MTETRQRVLVIGLDGATFDLIDPWIAQGHLPNLARLIANGARGQLRSTIQPTTAPAWVSFITGVNQGKHGLFDFVRRQAGSYNLEITNGAHVRAPSVFTRASEHGKRVVAVNIPYTSPPHPVNGVMVGGPFAPNFSPDVVYPRDYFERIQAWVPGYFILPDFDARTADPMAQYAARLQQGIGLRQQLSLKLMEVEDWDLFMVVFMATDEAHHTFWHCMEAGDGTPEAQHRDVILQIYKRLDSVAGTLVAAAQKDGEALTTFVVSDHGAGPFRWMINLNRWLANHGYLQFRQEAGKPVRRLQTGLVKRFASAYRRYLSGDLRLMIRSRLGARRFDRVKGEFESLLTSAAIDWTQTRAYSVGAGGNIYINLAGRELAGTVSPEHYEALRAELSTVLQAMRDPETGEPLVRTVHLREGLYHGAYQDQAPDLVIEWADYGNWGRGQYDSQAPVFQKQRQMDFSEQPLTGSHRLDGILIAHGPGIKTGFEVEGAHLLDMAPTLLALLGVPTPLVFDGRLLAELFDPDALGMMAAAIGEASSSPEAGPVGEKRRAFTPEEEERIAEHLRSLGYL